MLLDFPHEFKDGQEIPFGVKTVNAYRANGWRALMPLPYGKQDPPVEGFTGRHGEIADSAQLREWIIESTKGAKKALAGERRHAPLNIAIVHQKNTIAIDVDHYEYVDPKTGIRKIKQGGRSLKHLEEQYGRLPHTWVSSARGKPGRWGSGQRFFRIPAKYQDLGYRDKPGDSIEIVRGGHRYSVVWPSLNGRMGQIYEWWYPALVDESDPKGKREWKVMDGPPNVEDLPYLPEKWIEFLTNGFSKSKEKAKLESGVNNEDDVVAWVEDRARNNAGGWQPDGSGSQSIVDRGSSGEIERDEDAPEAGLCTKMAAVLEAALDEMPSGAHDTLTARLMEGIFLAHEGHSGIKAFLTELHDCFVNEVQSRRDGGASEAELEWFRSFRGSLEVVGARRDAPASSCPCFVGDADDFTGLRSEKDPADYDQSDDGNAEHLVDRYGSVMYYVPAWKCWAIWRKGEGVWIADEETVAVELARRIGVATQIRANELLEYIQDQKAAGAIDAVVEDLMTKKAGRLWKWGQGSRNRGKLLSMIEVAKSYPDMTKPAEDFDADPTLIVCKNGTLVLPARDYQNQNSKSVQVVLRENSQHDFNTMCTEVDYVPWAEVESRVPIAFKIVRDYLDVFLADPELRAYVQKVLGYTMYGANPERRIVFLQGKTSTGKSTILAAISGALGHYSAPFNLSLLRDKQDEGPRAELVATLAKRLITATEGSHQWHLHADMIKRVTGGSDKLSARKLHSNEMVRRVPAFTPVIATNSPPTIDAADGALWRRLIVLPFDRQVGMEGVHDHDGRIGERGGWDAVAHVGAGEPGAGPEDSDRQGDDEALEGATHTDVYQRGAVDQRGTGLVRYANQEASGGEAVGMVSPGVDSGAKGNGRGSDRVFEAEDERASAGDTAADPLPGGGRRRNSQQRSAEDVGANHESDRADGSVESPEAGASTERGEARRPESGAGDDRGRDAADDASGSSGHSDRDAGFVNRSGSGPSGPAAGSAVLNVEAGLDSDITQKVGMDAFMASDPGCKIVWLSWLVEGYQMYLREGISDDVMPAIVRKRTDAFQAGVSDFHGFLHDSLMNSNGDRVALPRLYYLYEAWCEAHKIQDRQRMSVIKFTRMIRDNGLEIVKARPRAGEHLVFEASSNAARNLKSDGSGLDPQYKVNWVLHVTLRPGAVQMLAALSDESYKVMVVNNDDMSAFEGNGKKK